jgi:hypothetical protein
MALLAVLVLTGAAVVGLSIRMEDERRFCTGGLAIGSPLGDDLGLLMPEDQDPPGPGPCDLPTDGSYPDPVARGDDCTVVYPDDWTEDRPLLRIEPLNDDGTCWNGPLD